VVKRVFAPTPRVEKAKATDVKPQAKDTAEALMTCSGACFAAFSG
jgi:hypothetical protein